MKYYYGRIKDKRDVRDFGFHRFVGVSTPPNEFSFVNDMPTPKNQFQVGSCVSFATGYAIAFEKKRDLNVVFDPSNKFIFDETLKAENRLGQDGEEIRDALGILQTLGVCPESEVPYNQGNDVFNNFETPQALADALGQRIASYARLDTVDSVKIALSQRIPVVAGITVYDVWQTQDVDVTGVIPDPEGQVVGGHAICLCGFDDLLQEETWANGGGFYFENSWYLPDGSPWAYQSDLRAGFGKLSYDYVNQDISSGNVDLWASVDFVPTPTPQPTPTPAPTPSSGQNLIAAITDDKLVIRKLLFKQPFQ